MRAMRLHLLLATMLLPSLATLHAASQPRPNILLIMTDEHNAAVMGCAGDKIARTPHLDNLASQGILFDAH
jgi:choline-sulfatase